MDQPIINIWGEKVALGPVDRERLPVYVRWVNTFEATATLAIPTRPYSVEQETEWYESASRKADQTPFDIFERSSMRLIGNTDLHAIDLVNGTAEFGILIGETDCWDKGYGTEAAQLVLDYGFRTLGLHNIMLRVYGHNARAQRAYSKAGFKPVGVRREARRVGQQRVDEILMDCLAAEFLAPS